MANKAVRKTVKNNSVEKGNIIESRATGIRRA